MATSTAWWFWRPPCVQEYRLRTPNTAPANHELCSFLQQRCHKHPNWKRRNGGSTIHTLPFPGLLDAKLLTWSHKQ